MLSILVFRPRPVCEMAVDPRLGQFNSGFAQEPERTGSVGVLFPTVQEMDILQTPWKVAG